MAPQFLDQLVERFDPEGFDAPDGRARVRVRNERRREPRAVSLTQDPESGVWRPED